MAVIFIVLENPFFDILIQDRKTMKTLFRVLAQTEPSAVQKQDGSTIQKGTLILQEVGSRYEDSYVVTLLGTLATSAFYPGEVVWASLRFQAKEYHPGGDPARLAYLMDVTAQDIVRMNQQSTAF